MTINMMNLKLLKCFLLFGSLVASINSAVAAPPFAQAGQVVISEFRMSGPGGQGDKYVELYNNTNSDLSIDNYTIIWQSALGDNLGINLPNLTVIKAHSHYLITARSYSLESYATGDYKMNFDFSLNSGIALFTRNGISIASRMDSVLFSDARDGVFGTDLFKEGTPLPQTGATTEEHAWVRKLSSGFPQDTNNNAADFILVSTTATMIGGVQSILGAPGPENSLSPENRTDILHASLLDATKSVTVALNRVRDVSSYNDTLSGTGLYSLGIFSIRRKFTNNTGQPVTRLRFRIVNATMGPASTGTADLRAITSAPIMVSTDDTSTCASTPGASSVTAPCTIPLQGLILEQPPNQALGGGLNSTISAGTVTVVTPLAVGTSVNVNFLLGVKQTGAFNFYVTVDARP